MRSALLDVAAWERGMTEALYANGMIGGDDLSRELTAIQSHAETVRNRHASTDLEVVEEQLSGDAPYPATAEADPDG